MKTIKPLSFCFIATILLTSCAKIFYSPDAIELAQKQKNIAIIPPTVSIAANRKIDAEAMKEQQKTESLNFQKEMYSWMLRRKMQGKITQEIQELETTNALLKKAGYPEKPLTSSEICLLLGVDGIMTSNYGMSKPMSDGAAVALAVLVGTWGATNQVSVSLSISDCNNKKMIWNYDHKFNGSLGSTPSSLVDGLMRNASKNMPYIK